MKKMKTIRKKVSEKTLEEVLVQEFLEGRSLDSRTKAIYDKKTQLRQELILTINGKEKQIFDEIEELQAEEQAVQLFNFVEFILGIFGVDIDKNALLKNILNL